jgi:hypothetical protein
MNTRRLLLALVLTSTLVVGCSGGSTAASLTPAPAGSSTATQDCTNIAPLADLQGCDFSGASFPLGNLTAVNLSGADLTGAYLFGANLTTANLKGADLTGADLRTANLTGADFTDANLTGADLTAAAFAGATFTDANLTGTTMPDGSVHP